VDSLALREPADSTNDPDTITYRKGCFPPKVCSGFNHCIAVDCSVVSYSMETLVVSSLSSFLANWMVRADPYGSVRAARVYSSTFDPENALLMVRKDVSKMTWSTGSSATREWVAVPAMVPAVDGLDGNLTVQLRSVAVVRIAWWLESVQQSVHQG
jgi:hypothetical protein